MFDFNGHYSETSQIICQDNNNYDLPMVSILIARYMQYILNSA